VHLVGCAMGIHGSCYLGGCIYILNRHEYGNADQTVELLRTCNKGMKMNCWESRFIHIFQQQDTLIKEQRVNNLNPLYTLANVTR